jgi:hypothetical protein
LQRNPALQAELAKLEYQNAKLYWYLIGTGWLSQQIHWGPDNYLFPRMMRHHLSNAFDVQGFAAIVNFKLITECQRYYPVAIALTGLALGTAWEIFTAKNDILNLTDIGLYGAGTTYYAIRHRGLRQRLQKRLKEFPRARRPISSGTGAPCKSPESAP